KSLKRLLNVSGVVPRYEARSFLLIGNSMVFVACFLLCSCKNNAIRVSTFSETKIADCFSELAKRLENSFNTLIEMDGYFNNNCCKSSRLITQICEYSTASAKFSNTVALNNANSPVKSPG